MPRILIVENNKDWSDKLIGYLDGTEFECDLATNREEAVIKLRDNLYDIVSLDLQLAKGKTIELDGFKILEDLDLSIPCPILIVSAYTTKPEFAEKVIDLSINRKYFIDKYDITRKVFIERIGQLLAESEFNANLEISTVGDQEISGIERGLFCFLFFRAKSIIVQKLGGGRTAAQVYAVMPKYPDVQIAAPCIVKIDSAECIKEDNDRYERFVEPALNSVFWARRRREPRFWRNMGAIVYELVGAHNVMDTKHFQEFLVKEDTSSIVQVVENLFELTMAPWVNYMENPSPTRPQEEYGMDFCNLEILEGQLCNFWQTQLNRSKYPISHEVGLKLENEYPNLVTFIKERIYSSAQMWRRTIVHGDLHPRNIIIDDSLNAWLIDFSNTRSGHACVDFAMLEMSIKNDLVMNDPKCLKDMLSMEERLSDQKMTDVIPEFVPTENNVHIAYACSRKIRETYARKSSPHEKTSFTDYKISLLMHSIFLFNRRMRPWENKEGIERKKEFFFIAAHFYAKSLQ